MKSEASASLTVSFVVTYLLVIVIQISCLLYAAHILVPFLWKMKLDPDNAAVPALMATADLLGTVFLTTAYFVLKLLGDHYVTLSTNDSLTSTLTSSILSSDSLAIAVPVYPSPSHHVPLSTSFS
jgi:hypothetical protein